MASISGTVGNGGLNRVDDVRAVQGLLNRQVKRLGLPPLATDGGCGPRTIEAIRQFQKTVMRLKMPDGRVDPKGETIVQLEGKTSARPIPEHVKAFIEMMLPVARQTKQDWSVPIAALIAQGALESGWGRSVVSNAYFGIKGKSLQGSVEFTTQEFIDGKSVKLKDSFRSYKNLSEAADDYGRFLNENPRYSKAFLHKNDPQAFINAIAASNYATDPEYANKLISIIRRYELGKYDISAASKEGR